MLKDPYSPYLTEYRHSQFHSAKLGHFIHYHFHFFKVKNFFGTGKNFRSGCSSSISARRDIFFIFLFFFEGVCDWRGGCFFSPDLIVVL
jgi:hypothetical protein